MLSKCNVLVGCTVNYESALKTAFLNAESIILDSYNHICDIS